MRTSAFIAAFLAAHAAAQAGDLPPGPQPWAGVTVEEAYDSNVMNQLGPDAVTRVSPRGGLYWESRRGTLLAEYLAALHAYAFGTADSSVNHKAQVSAELRASRRLDLEASAALVVADDPILLDRAAVAVPQGGVVDFAGRASGAYRVTRRLGATAGYEGRFSRFEDTDGLEFADGDEHRVDAGMTYRLTRRLDGAARSRWHHFVSYLDTGTGHQDAVGGTAGVSWRATRLWRFGAEAGPMYLTLGDGQLSFVGGARAVRAGRRHRFTFAASRDVYGATGAPGAVWSDAARLDWAWRVTRQTAFRARISAYRTDDTLNDGSTIGVVGRAELGWMTRKGGWRIDLYAEHREQDQDAAGGFAFGDVQRTIAGLRLSALIGTDFLSLEDMR